MEYTQLLKDFLDGCSQQPKGQPRTPSATKMEDILRDILSMEYVYDLIYGHLERLDAIRPIIAAANIDIHPQIILTIVFDDFWNICKQLHNRQRYRLKRVILNSARAAMEPDLAAIATTLVGTDKVVIVLNCAERQGAQAERYAEECAQRIQRFILKETGISSSVGISNYCKDSTLLWQAYEQSFQALGDAFRHGQGQSLRYQRPTKDVATASPTAVRERAKEQLILALSQASQALCKQAVSQLTQCLVAVHADTAHIKALVVTLLSEIAHYCIHLGLDSPQVLARLTTATADIFQTTTLQGIQNHSLTFLSHMLQERSQAVPDGVASFIPLAKAYIGQYYDEQLTLTGVAAIVGYSPAYFSRRFKSHTKVNFSHYLTQIRVDSAKVFLANPKLSIDEIALKSGFQSRSYFSSTFLRLTGQTPHQFRMTPPSPSTNPVPAVPSQT